MDTIMRNGWRTHHLFGVPIHALTMNEVLKVVDEAVRSRRRLLIGVVNAAKMVNIKRDVSLGRAVLSADLILPDGAAVVWACRLLGRSLPERVAGIDLMEHILESGQRHGYRIYCLGATEEIVSLTVQRIQTHYPGIVIAGRRNGYFEEDEESKIAEEILAARPDVLFVGMSSPKKEQFLARWTGKMKVPVCHGVGGAFDVFVGKVQRAPKIWQRLGMEWLYRVFQEPRRMWRRYLVTNTLFCGMVIGEFLGWFRAERS